MTGCATSQTEPATNETEIKVRITPYPYNADRYGEDLPLEIGRFDVPAIRGDSGSGRLELGYLRYPAAEGARGLPYVVLTDAPAAEALSQQRIAELRGTGDVIIFNRRGYGFSSPPPPCPGRINYPFERALEPDLLSTITCAFARSCLDVMTGNGLESDMYSEKEVAADLDALRRALDVSGIRILETDNVRSNEPHPEIDALAARLATHPVNIKVESRSGRRIEMQIGQLDLAFLRFNNLVGLPTGSDRLTEAARAAMDGEFEEMGHLVLEMRRRLGDLSSVELLRTDLAPDCDKTTNNRDSVYSPRRYAELWPSSGHTNRP